ncbi:unnamed protein product, partial [Effrenium voratum]
RRFLPPGLAEVDVTFCTAATFDNDCRHLGWRLSSAAFSSLCSRVRLPCWFWQISNSVHDNSAEQSDEPKGPGDRQAGSDAPGCGHGTATARATSPARGRKRPHGDLSAISSFSSAQCGWAQPMLADPSAS